MGTLSLLRQKVPASHYRHILPKPLPVQDESTRRVSRVLPAPCLPLLQEPPGLALQIEAFEFDQVPRLLFAAVKVRKADMNKEDVYGCGYSWLRDLQYNKGLTNALVIQLTPYC